MFINASKKGKNPRKIKKTRIILVATLLSMNTHTDEKLEICKIKLFAFTWLIMQELTSQVVTSKVYGISYWGLDKTRRQTFVKPSNTFWSHGEQKAMSQTWRPHEGPGRRSPLGHTLNLKTFFDQVERVDNHFCTESCNSSTSKAPHCWGFPTLTGYILLE